MTTLTLTRLTKDFPSRAGAVRALGGLDLRAESGELLAVLGPSGCGKTTALRLIAGLLDPTSGDIAFDGESVLRLPPESSSAQRCSKPDSRTQSTASATRRRLSPRPTPRSVNPKATLSATDMNGKSEWL